MRRTLALLTLPILAACSHGGPPSAPTDPPLVTTTLDRDFELRVGGRAEVDVGGLTIVFLGVGEDSRCPSDVVCVWSGDAAVRLSMSVGRQASHPMTLHTHVEPRAIELSGYRVRLVSLSPYPDTRDPIEPDEYVARLRVERTAAPPAG